MSEVSSKVHVASCLHLQSASKDIINTLKISSSEKQNHQVICALCMFIANFKGFSYLTSEPWHLSCNARGGQKLLQTYRHQPGRVNLMWQFCVHISVFLFVWTMVWSPVKYRENFTSGIFLKSDPLSLKFSWKIPMTWTELCRLFPQREPVCTLR